MNDLTITFFLIAFCLCLLLALIIREYQHQAERKDLTDRLMAKDYSEYKSLSKPAPSGPPRNFLIRNMKDSINKLDQNRSSE